MAHSKNAPDEVSLDNEVLEVVEEGAPEEEVSLDPAVLCPGPDAEAEPYRAILSVDADGKTNGELWAFNGKMMLFESQNAGEKVLAALGEGSGYDLRGVTAGHLAALRSIARTSEVELFVVVGMSPQGKVEAMPLAEHQARKNKAGSPPPLPPRAEGA